MNDLTMLGRREGDVGTGDMVLVRGWTAMVHRVMAHLPGSHADSPIRDDLTAVEVVTAQGSRWVGADRAWIGGDLRMHWTREDKKSDTYNNEEK